MHQTPTVANARLNLPGLPSLTDQMLVGGLYALIAEMPPSRVPLLASSLAHAWNRGMDCTIILPSHPEAFLERIDALGIYDTRQAIDSGQLQIFLRQDNFSKNMFRFGADRFARELDHFGIPDGSYLIFDQADELFSLHDISLAMEQIEVLRLWFSKHRVTALLIFSRLNSNSADTLQAMMDQLSGIVKITSGRQGQELVFDYWQSPEGTIAARQYPLLTLDNGMYQIGVRANEDANDNVISQIIESVASGPAKFFYMDEDLSGLANELPGAWQQVNSLVGMLHATRGLHAATVILSFQRDTGLREIAETVHTLRTSLGKKAHIVVREKQASLRYQNEALLLRLGVNLVIHRDIPESRLPLLLESLQGQSFDRNVEIDFEVALASVIPSGARGYLLPARFAREASAIVERGAALNIPCALVIGELVRGTSFPDILGRVSISRPGDLLSSDGRACYLFFNGCPESALPFTIERILGGRVEGTFYDPEFLLDRTSIEAVLNALARVAREKNLPDYSTEPALEEELVNTVPEPKTAKLAKPELPAVNIIPKISKASQVPDVSVADSATVPVKKVSSAPQQMAKSVQADIKPVMTETKVLASTVIAEASPVLSANAMQVPELLAEVVSNVVTQPDMPQPRAANQVFGKQPAPRATRASYKKQTG